MPILSTALCAAVLGLSASAASARTYNVTRTDDPDNGMCAAPYTDCTLRETLNTINATPDPPDVINLGPGDYANARDLAFPIMASVSIVGPGSAETTVHGGPGVSVFDADFMLTYPVVSISGVTITGGTSSGPGGGIASLGELHLDRVALVGNSATFGGAVRSHNGPVTITNSLLADNSASGSGGAIAAGSTLSISNTTITGNTAGNGSSAAMGGGIYFFDGPSSLNIASSTIAGNTVTGPGSTGGNMEVSADEPSSTIVDSIVAEGHAPSGQNCAFGQLATLKSLGHNVEDANDCGLDGPGDKTNVDPRLGSLAATPNAASTLLLLPGSPAINNGAVGGCKDAFGGALTIDQRGVARPQGAACDSGAFEFRLPVITSVPLLSGTATVGNTLTCTAADATSPDGGPVTSAFTWLRDGSPISGASAATYQLAAADGGHQVACRQSSSNSAGPVSATSSAVSVPVPPPPPPPAPPKLTFPAKTVTINGHGTGSLGAMCDAPSGDTCTVTGTLYGAGRLPASAASLHKRAAKLGTVKGTIVAGARGRLTVRLTKAGKALLSTHARLRVRVVGTISDQAGASSKLREKLTLRRKRRV